MFGGDRHNGGMLKYVRHLQRKLGLGGSDALEEERKRLAREMHDVLAQDLLALLMKLRVEGGSPESVELASRLCREVRQWVNNLNPPPPMPLLGMIASLRRLAERTTSCRVDLQVKGASSSELKTVLPGCFDAVRIVEEATTNAVRHGRASCVWIDLHIRRANRDGRGEFLEIEISDDGQGFDPEQVLPRVDGGDGLRFMRQRVAAVQGTMNLDAKPGRGTRLKIQIPWPSQNTPTRRQSASEEYRPQSQDGDLVF